MATVYFLPTGEQYTGSVHTHDGHTMTGATHASESRILSLEDPGLSRQNPHLGGGNSSLETLCLQAIRQFGDFNPGTVDSSTLSMFLQFANQIIDEIRVHPYYSGYPVLDYYTSLTDTRPVNDAIIRSGLLYHYALQQGSEKIEIYAPLFNRTMNQQLWQELNGSTKIQMRIVDDGTNDRNFSGKTSTYNGLPNTTSS